MSSDTPHIRLYARCHLCDDRLRTGETCFVLAGHLDSTSPQVTITVRSYPSSNIRPSEQGDINGWRICRNSLCARCQFSSAVPTLHPVCLQVFMRNCSSRDALDRLWLAVVWRDGFSGPGIRPLELPQSPQNSAARSWALTLVSDKLGLPQINKLPQEIHDMIRDCLQAGIPKSHLIHRYAAALGFAWRLASMPSEPLSCVPLRKLASWTRGSMPNLVGEEGLPLPVIRYSIDSIGLQKIERLPAKPNFERKRYDNAAFVICQGDILENATLHLKDGFGRLEVPANGGSLQVWDTPTPPDLDGRTLCPRIFPRRFFTIDMEAITGLTFIMANSKVLAIHPHTRAAPSAASAVDGLFDMISPGLDLLPKVVWVYIPIPRGEKLIQLGSLAVRTFGNDKVVQSRENQRFLFHMAMAGNVTVGRMDRNYNLSFVLSEGQAPITTLVYATSYRRLVSFVSTYCDQDVEDNIVLRPPCLELYDCPYRNWYASHGILRDISRIHLFEKDGYCRGLLLEYEDGQLTALGQCRLHVDPVRIFVKPWRICFARCIQLRDGHDDLSRTKIHIDIGPTVLPRRDEDYRWNCFDMSGHVLGFYYHEPEEQTYLSVLYPFGT